MMKFSNFNDVKNLVNKTIKFSDSDIYVDGYFFDPDMIGRVVKVNNDGADIFSITVDFSDFMSHNEKCFVSNYYNNFGEPKLNVVESGLWNDTQIMVFDYNTELPFEILDV